MLISRILIARLVMIAAGVAGSTTAMADFASPVPSHDPPGLYGPNRIGANDVTSALEGRRVDACGRVGVVNAAMHALQIGNRLVVFMPPGMDPTPYYGTVICAAGIVHTQTMNGWTQPTITAETEQQFVQIGGTGHYNPPQPQCPNAQVQSDGSCGRRWRASPY